MAGKRVAVLDPEGNFGTVDEADVANLPEGAKVLTRQQLAERAADERYAQKSTAGKIVDAASFAGPVPFAARAIIGGATGQGAVPELPPAVESYAKGVDETFTGGAAHLGIKGLAELGGGDQAGKQYVERVDTAAEANPTAHALGQVAGVAGSVSAGGPKGAGALGKAIPGVGIGAVGGAVESGVGKALSGLATKGALGRAAATGARLAARGVVEGGALGGVAQATDAVAHGDPVFGEKLYAAVGHGALAGGTLGGILGTAGSLGASGARAVRGALARTATKEAPLALSPGGLSDFEGPVEHPGRIRSKLDLDAGIGEASEAEQAINIGRPEQHTGLRPNVYQRGSAPKASRQAFDFETRTRQFPEPGAGLPETSFKINPDAGLSVPQRAQAAKEASDVFRFLRPQQKAGLSPMGEAVEVGAPPIQIGAVADAADRVAAREAGATAPRKALGIADLLSQPTSTARALAEDQAAASIFRGNGLQSTRYVKEAAKYFPGGTRELGEMMFRHGIIDTTETATPMQAAIKAAKAGTPADMLPKLQAAGESVGQKIGDITDGSGARVPIDQIMKTVRGVAGGYEKQASRGHLATAVHAYADELANALPVGRDGKVAIRDLLAQRKILDDSVYTETKTLDPRGRVKALREVRGKLEDVITHALDDASGKMKGETAKEYNTLKRDYHGLRILTEAAEDSAARHAKASTFGLFEKAGAALSLATGHIPVAPVLAVGGKIARERGNAAAAAFLARAADNGSVEAVVAKFNARVRQSAATALHEAPVAKRVERSSRDAPARGKEEVARTQAQAKKIVEWVGSHQANPGGFADKLADEATHVSRAAGSAAADTYTANAVKAVSFIASYVPVRDRRDPLDPRSVPPMTYDEASRLVRATKYATHPDTIYADFGQGRITPEGIAAAQTFTPNAFIDFQSEMQRLVEDRMMRGERFTQSQRLRIDKLLGYPAGADLRPAAIARLQANLQPAPPEPPPASGATGHKPVDMKVQQTGFDRIEARQATS